MKNLCFNDILNAEFKLYEENPVIHLPNIRNWNFYKLPEGKFGEQTDERPLEKGAEVS